MLNEINDLYFARSIDIYVFDYKTIAKTRKSNNKMSYIGITFLNSF